MTDINYIVQIHSGKNVANMSLGISSYLSSFSNGSSGINKNSAQYKAVVKNSLAGILESEAKMSKEERLVYELLVDVMKL